MKNLVSRFFAFVRSIPRRYKIAAILVVFLIAGLAFAFANRANNSPRIIPISELLDMADHQQIQSVVIVGNTLYATDNRGNIIESAKEDQYPITDALRRDAVTVSVANQNDGVTPNVLVAIFPLIAILALIWLTTRRGGLNSQAFSFGKSGARSGDPKKAQVTFDDVAGVEEAKQELNEIVQFLRDADKFRALGARVPKGVLLIGPPGTGKTLIARAVAGEAGVPFFSISGSEFVEMFVGVGASRVRDLFRQAKKAAPCIIFIDEIDAVGRQRGTSVGGNDEREQTLNQLLVEMDGFDPNLNIIVIAATNRPDVLDQALLRPGRFDRRVTLDPPDINGRRAILEVHSRFKPLEPSIDLATIAQQTPGFSGADLANLINEAAILAARADKSFIGRAELDEGLLRVIAGPERRNRVINDYEKSIIAYHEIGHAMVMKALKHAHPVQKVSVISRGQALGITFSSPKEDTYLTSRAQLMARLTALLGGRAAEEIIFGDITTGARQDLESVTDLAHRMVVEFGMSGLGIVPLRRSEGSPHSYSGDELASQIDRAAAEIIDVAYGTARAILKEREKKLVEVAEHLKHVETIDGEELDLLLGMDWTLYQAPWLEDNRIMPRPVAV